MELHISVNEKNKNTLETGRRGADLVEAKINLTPDAAVGMADALIREAAPIIAWRSHPLRQWANRKTGKA